MKNHSNLPINGDQVRGYYSSLTRTPEFLQARTQIGGEYGPRIEAAPTDSEKRRLMTAMTRFTFAQTASNLNKGRNYEQFAMDATYNTMVSTLPDLNEGMRGLREHDGSLTKNKKLIIPFNHAIKDVIDAHQSTTLPQLTEMLENTFFIGGYTKGLLQDVNHNIIPGMIHELAGVTNLYYLPGEPDIIDTTVQDELHGVDEKVLYEDGTLITIDFKKSEAAALEAQKRHIEWREAHNIIEPDSHIILATGYTDTDFIKDKIGRVSDAARLREQPRYNAILENKHQELVRQQQYIDSLVRK